MKIRRMTSPFRIKDLKSTMHDMNEYILILIYIFIVKKNDIKIFYRIYKEIHFVDNLKAYILLNNNIINFEKIVLNVAQNKIYIDNYEIIIIITSRQRDSYQRRIIYIKKILIITPHINIMISINTSKTLFEKDFIFEFMI